MPFPCVLFLLSWVTASSSLEHNNVVVNGKHQTDTLSQVQLHKQVRLSKRQAEGARERRGERDKGKVTVAGIKYISLLKNIQKTPANFRWCQIQNMMRYYIPHMGDLKQFKEHRRRWSLITCQQSWTHWERVVKQSRCGVRKLSNS